MSKPKPVIIIVPGAFHKASHFYKLAMHLTVAGFTASVLDLPSTTDGAYEPQVYQKDIATIADAIREFTNVGREVVLVMHGYAGNPGTQAAHSLGQTASTELDADSHGAVVKLIYLAAWLPLEGQSLLSLPWPPGEEPFHVAYEKDDRFIRANNPREKYFNDLADGPVVEAAIDVLEPKILDHDFTGPDQCAWRQIPAAYIQCEIDRVLPLAVTNAMLQHVEAAGVKVDVETMKCGHAPMMSQPKKTAQLIAKLIGNTSL